MLSFEFEIDEGYDIETCLEQVRCIPEILNCGQIDPESPMPELRRKCFGEVDEEGELGCDNVRGHVIFEMGKLPVSELEFNSSQEML
jgi:hypothetical protein